MTLLSINWGNALIVTVLGFVIVFIVLVLLIFIISLFGKVMAPKATVTKSTASESHDTEPTRTQSREHISALDSAAIATAIHLYFDDPHDEESGVVTIKTVERRYSPWNSKIYGLNNNLTR